MPPADLNRAGNDFFLRSRILLGMIDVGCERLLTSFVDSWNSRFPHPSSHLDGTIPTLRLLYFASSNLEDTLGRDLYLGYIIGDCWTTLDGGGVSLWITEDGTVMLRSENLGAELNVSGAFESFLNSPFSIPDWLPEDENALIFEQYVLGLLLGNDPQIKGGVSRKPLYALAERLVQLSAICRAALNANIERYCDLPLADELSIPGCFLLLPLTHAGESPFQHGSEILQESVFKLPPSDRERALRTLCSSPSRLLELSARALLLSIESAPTACDTVLSPSEIEILRDVSHTLRKNRGEAYDWRLALHDGDLELAKKLLDRDCKQGLFPLFFGDQSVLEQREGLGLLSAAAVGHHLSAIDDAPPAHVRESNPALELQYLYILLHCEECPDIFERLAALDRILPTDHPLRWSLCELEGLAYREEEKNSEALRCFEEALLRAPSDPQIKDRILYQCAWSTLIAGENTRCRELLSEAPRSRLFLEIEFLLAERSGETKEEQRLLAELLTIAPTDSELIELALQKS